MVFYTIREYRGRGEMSHEVDVKWIQERSLYLIQELAVAATLKSGRARQAALAFSVFQDRKCTFGDVDSATIDQIALAIKTICKS